MQMWPDENRFVGIGTKVLFLLLATVIPSGDSEAEDSARDAERLLRVRHGLRTLTGGTVWLSQAEGRVRRCLASLDDARREIIRRRQALDDRRRRNLALWEAAQRKIAVLKKALTSPNADSAEKRRIKKQIGELESQAVAPNRLASQPDVRSDLIQLINARHRLALRLLELQRLIPVIDAQYAELAVDRDVLTAIRTLGPAHRLGPLSDSYDDQLRRLRDYRREVFTAWVPAYQQSGRIRVGAIVNEIVPVTFTWRESNDPAVLTAAMAEAIGLDPPKPGERAIQITMGESRRVSAYRATIPTLRLGKQVIRDVPCLVLPAEAEDLGAQISAAAFPEFETRVELENLQLVFRGRGSASLEEANDHSQRETRYRVDAAEVQAVADDGGV